MVSEDYGINMEVYWDSVHQLRRYEKVIISGEVCSEDVIFFTMFETYRKEFGELEGLRELVKYLREDSKVLEKRYHKVKDILGKIDSDLSESLEERASA